MGKLTDTKIKSLTFKGKSKKYSDGGGLHLLVNTSGKYWRYSYRFGKKQKTLAIGVYPTISLKEARKSHQNAKDFLEQGIDPCRTKKTKKTLSENVISFEMILKEWQALNEKRWSLATTEKRRQVIERDILPWLKDIPIRNIEPPEILSVLKRIEERGSHYTTREAKSIISRTFCYGIAKGACRSDPSRDLSEALTPFKKGHLAAITEPKAVSKLLRDIDDCKASFVVKIALQLIPYTLLRPGEFRFGKWSEISFNEALWRIPGVRMKGRQDHIVPLSKQAVTKLKELYPLTKKRAFIFPGQRDKRKPISENTLSKVLRRIGYRKEEHCPHGFRKTASTLLNERDWKEDHIEMQLAHKDSNEIRGTYNHAKWLSQRIKMMQFYADYLDKIKQNPR